MKKETFNEKYFATEYEYLNSLQAFLHKWPLVFHALCWLDENVYNSNNAEKLALAYENKIGFSKDLDEIYNFCSDFFDFDFYDDNILKRGIFVRAAQESFEYCVYSIVYCSDVIIDQRRIDNLFDTFLPLTSHFARYEFGEDFYHLSCVAFARYVDEYLYSETAFKDWIIDDPEEIPFWADYLVNPNERKYQKARRALLDRTGLPELPNPFLPPSWVYNEFLLNCKREEDEVKHLERLKNLYRKSNFNFEYREK